MDELTRIFPVLCSTLFSTVISYVVSEAFPLSECLSFLGQNLKKKLGGLYPGPWGPSFFFPHVVYNVAWWKGCIAFLFRLFFVVWHNSRVDTNKVKKKVILYMYAPIPTKRGRKERNKKISFAKKNFCPKGNREKNLYFCGNMIGCRSWLFFMTRLNKIYVSVEVYRSSRSHYNELGQV